eukprot:8589067-Pyramimonas_sp.AAC.1
MQEGHDRTHFPRMCQYLHRVVFARRLARHCGGCTRCILLLCRYPQLHTGHPRRLLLEARNAHAKPRRDETTHPAVSLLSALAMPEMIVRKSEFVT